MNLRGLAAGAVLFVASTSAAQAETPVPPSPKLFWAGAGGATLFSPAPGVVPTLGLAMQRKGFVVFGEGFWGHDLTDFDLFYGGAAGKIFGTAPWSPYALVGVGRLARGVFDTRGHDADVLTLEAGTVMARTGSGLQLWIAARGFIPVSELSSFGRSYGGPPTLPFLSINLRLWVGLL